MTTDGSAPAFARAVGRKASEWSGHTEGAAGLTKREYFAAQCLGAMMLAEAIEDSGYANFDSKAESAVMAADSLIDALNLPSDVLYDSSRK